MGLHICEAALDYVLSLARLDAYPMPILPVRIKKVEPRSFRVQLTTRGDELRDDRRWEEKYCADKDAYYVIPDELEVKAKNDAKRRDAVKVRRCFVSFATPAGSLPFLSVGFLKHPEVSAEKAGCGSCGAGLAQETAALALHLWQSCWAVHLVTGVCVWCVLFCSASSRAPSGTPCSRTRA